MKRFISLFLIFSNLASANCNWSSITPLKDGGYEYPSDVHLCVGNLVQDSQAKDKQIQDLYSAIDLKNAALTAADTRTQMWQKASEDEADRILKITENQSHSDWLFFGLGALTILGSGFLTARLIGR